MTSCQQTMELISKQMDEPIACRQRLALRMHLLLCAACREFKSGVESQRQLLRAELSNDQEYRLSEEAKSRIRAFIVSGERTH